MNDAPRTVLIAGASGLIGTELATQLRAAGHTVLSLVRGEPRDDTQFTWIPSAGVVDTTLFDRADVVVNLSGASLGRLPWTRGYKREIVDSRVDATRTLVAGMRADRVARHQLRGDCGGGVRMHPARDVDRRQLGQLAAGIVDQFAPFAREFGALGIRLRADRDIFARRHRHGAGDEPGYAGDQNAAAGGLGGGNPNDQAGGGQDAVIGAEHGGAQPADPLDRVAFGMEAQPAHGAFCKHIWYGATEARATKTPIR